MKQKQCPLTGTKSLGSSKGIPFWNKYKNINIWDQSYKLTGNGKKIQTIKLGRSLAKHLPHTIINIEAFPDNSDANLRLNYLGGNRKESIDHDASYKKQDVVYGETDQVISFNDKFKSLPIVSLTLSYRINNENYSSVWSLQILNLMGTGEYSHDYYNLKTKNMNTKYDGIVVPNLSYRIEF